jgi:Transglutaminase-like superfamily
MLRKLRLLADVSPGEWLLLSQLALCAMVVGIALRITTLPRLTGFNGRCATHRRLRHFPFFHAQHQLTRLAILADWAVRITLAPGPCLTRSLLLFWLLKAQGEPTELFIGINKETAALHGHAWIETRGQVVSDSPAMAGRFVTLLRF